MLFRNNKYCFIEHECHMSHNVKISFLNYGHSCLKKFEKLHHITIVM